MKMKQSSYIALLLEKWGGSDTQLLFLNYLKRKLQNFHSAQELYKSVSTDLRQPVKDQQFL